MLSPGLRPSERWPFRPVWLDLRTGSNIGLPGGTGLGLALVRSIAQGHGGEVLVRSAPGKGSMFKLMLPAMTAAGEGPAGIHAHAGAAESSGTWLPR